MTQGQDRQADDGAQARNHAPGAAVLLTVAATPSR
jgi:hypothetical protein